MEVNMCRCCRAQGVHKDLHTSYVWLDKKEVYGDMLHECFNIILSTAPNTSNGICDTCISTLRGAHLFKQQVLNAENEFLKTLTEYEYKEDNKISIKLEPNHYSDDSDDYFLADAVKHIAAEEIDIKEEIHDTPSRKKTLHVRTKKPRKSSLRSDSIKSLVNKLANSYELPTLPDVTIKRRKPIELRNSIVIKTVKKNPSPKPEGISLTWTKHILRQDKTKHIINLETILNYSNAIIFTDITLLGITCGYCEDVYPNVEDLRKHTKTKHKKERINLVGKDMGDIHIKLDITDLTCTLCDDPMDTLTQFKEHLTKVHNKKFFNDITDHLIPYKPKPGDVFDCALCNATYETFKMLKQHMNKHFSNYTCEVCGCTFITKRSLRFHSTTHIKGSFKCDDCEKMFDSKMKKSYHQKMSHQGHNNIGNCPYCNESFRNYYQKNRHMVQVHNSEAKYKCNICNRSFILKSILMQHVKKNHLMERNNQCKECGFRFFSKKSLKAHMVKHTGEKNYVCQVCHKAYGRRFTLREHMRIHNNDRRFKCDVCALTFVQKCSLKSHLLSNHGISMAAADISIMEQHSDSFKVMDNVK